MYLAKAKLYDSFIRKEYTAFFIGGGDMLAIILIFAFIYFIMWFFFKALGLALKIAVFPIKLIVGLVLAIIGFVVFPALIIFFIIPLIAILVSWTIGKIISPI